MKRSFDLNIDGNDNRPVVLRLIGLVSGEPHPCDGQYVVKYHAGPAEYPARECLLEATPDINKARVYASYAAAHMHWRMIDPREPIRADGKPNRPLTAWSVVIVPVVETQKHK